MLRGRAWLAWTVVYLCCGLISFQRANHCLRRPSLCMDVYWLEAWLVESTKGVHARGLLGAVTHLLSKTGPDAVIINIIALSVSIGIAITLITLLYLKSTTLWSRLGVAAIAASPLCALFFEEVGDPLMVAFALFLIAALLISRTTSRPVHWVVSIVFSLAVVAIHEASLFLFVPALVLIGFTPQLPGRAAVLKYAAVAIPLLALIVLDKAPNRPNPDYRAYNSITHEVIPRDKEPFPVYSQLLREEARNYFGSPVKILQFVLKFPRVWCITLLGLVLLSGVVARDSAQRLWRHWLYLSLCSAPLYVIAHDWARFSVITFWLAMIAVWLREPRDSQPANRPLPGVVQALIPQRLPAEAIVFGVAGSLILAANALYPDYGINGMPAASLPIVVPTFLAWLSWLAWSRNTPAAADQP